MSPTSDTIEPVFTDAERDELGHLDYLVARLDELCQRGLLTPEARARIVAESRCRRAAIDLIGRYNSAIEHARKLVKSNPQEALGWAERARELDSGAVDAWKLIVVLNWDLGNDDDAIARCSEAAQRFPEFESEVERLRAERARRGEERRLRAEKARQDAEAAHWQLLAKQALEEKRDAEVIALAHQILAVRPGNIDALVVMAYAQQRSGQLDPALESYEALSRLQPFNKTWLQWIRNIQLRRGVARLTGTTIESTAADGAAGDRAGLHVGEFVGPSPISWSSFAAEFLEDHWQKLILCLAVLLIVVSSTVGAHLLLGPLLWSAVGKCTLAMVATLLFAAFGAGLVRWGADRAGRVMLIATLIVVPIHFMLVGEMKLLRDPSVLNLAFLAIEGAVLVAMVRWVSGMLEPVTNARFLTAALMLLSLGTAATTRGSPTTSGLQLASFELSPLVFLGAVWALGARRWGDTSSQHRDFVYMALGLLGFALVACLARTGGYALRLDAALYGLPAMLIAVSCVHAARRLAPDEPDKERLAFLRLGGYALSGLAFALVLARPPIASPVYSGNTLAVSLLGLGLYAGSLKLERHPAFLYMAVGAIVAGRLGAHYFLAERLHALEDTVRRLLGYPHLLPVSFRAILAVIPSMALAWLALWFPRHWDDRRLARHCHYIGVPLSVAACIWSAFEPLAAVICLTAYAVLYLLAIWIFAAPWVTYLAAAALAGACYFGISMVHGVTSAEQALVAGLLGLAYWGVRVGLRRSSAAAPYHVPWLHAALVLTGGSMAAATAHLIFAGIDSRAAAASFVVISVLSFLLNRERPRRFWAQLALISFVEFTICSMGLLIGTQSLAAHHYGLLFMVDALAIVAFGLALRDSEAAKSDWAGTFLDAIPRSTIVLTVIADWLGFLNINETGRTGLVFLLGSAALLGTTRFRRYQALVYFGLAQIVAGTLDLTWYAAGWNVPDITTGWMAVAMAVLALALWFVGVAARRAGFSEFYTEPSFQTAFALTTGAYLLALCARSLGREAYLLATAALGMNVVVTMLLGHAWRQAKLTYAAVVHLVTATYLILFSVGNNDPRMAYVLGLCAVADAIVLWGIGLVCELRGTDWLRECARPLYHSAVLLTVLAVPLADRSSVVLALVSVSALLTVKSLPRTEWLYGATAALLAACYMRWLRTVTRTELIGWAIVAAFGLWGTAFLIQRHKQAICRRLGLSSLPYEFPLFHSSIVVAIVALLLRFDLSVGQGVAFSAHGWLTTALSVLSLVMLRAYPRRECVHVSLAFLTWSIVTAVTPSLTPVSFLALGGILSALGYLMIERLLGPHEPAICDRFGVIDAGYAPVVRDWALSCFSLAAGLAVLVVVVETSRAIQGPVWIDFGFAQMDWWVILATLALAGVFLAALGSDSEGYGLTEPEHLILALHWLSVPTIWWMGVACSPFSWIVSHADDYFPLATAVAALATIQLGRQYAHPESWHELGWLRNLRSAVVERMLAGNAFALTALAVVFTKGTMAPATVLTLGLSSLTLGLVTLSHRWKQAALAGSAAWTATWAVAGSVLSLKLGWTATGLRVTCASAGGLAAAFSLLWLAGLLRRDQGSQKGRAEWTADSTPGTLPILAWTIEAVAFVSSLLVVTAVLIVGTDPGTLGAWGTAAGIGVIMGAAVLFISLVERWQAEWLIHLAQTVILCAYVDYRLAFPQPIAFDAIVLTLLGYLDLGIAEVFDRLQRKMYARPTRYFSLVLPVLPLIQLIWMEGLTEVSLFHLLAAGSFYAIACGQMRWKSLGYVAALFYNAALWVLWGKFGWTLSSHPQFFLVPVGLSTILFAQVNRRELGRQNVNTIRAVGLSIVYLSLAVPIWQFESFGAWVTLLICSLATVFVAIGLRLQTFLWMGLTTFVLDVVYEMGRVSLDYAFAKWAIMLAMGIMLVMFVALNEKKRIVTTMRLYYEQARLWE